MSRTATVFRWLGFALLAAALVWACGHVPPGWLSFLRPGGAGSFVAS